MKPVVLSFMQTVCRLSILGILSLGLTLAHAHRPKCDSYVVRSKVTQEEATRILGPLIGHGPRVLLANMFASIITTRFQSYEEVIATLDMFLTAIQFHPEQTALWNFKPFTLNDGSRGFIGEVDGHVAYVDLKGGIHKGQFTKNEVTGTFIFDFAKLNFKGRASIKTGKPLHAHSL